ncbi:MAG: 1-acyl-sn-glycerol-3-phosphate acyltransferase [Bacteroidales bacterium]|nr:1-acyl-sn-glycerol-3-phosphate acyltransferase [Bacteroidales bacterium]
MTDKFASIRHYNKREALVAQREVFANKDLERALNYLNMGITIEGLKEDCKHFKSLYDFQAAVPGRFLQYYSDRTTTHVSYNGLENLDLNKSYLFIANHRDIVMDSAYLQLYFFHNKINTSKIAIGDNLVSTPLMLSIAKLNKMFLVKRSATLRENLVNSKLLSEYIHEALAVEHESVWIAQRNGRTKNGFDQTQQGLVKMLTYFDENRDVLGVLKEMHITPITVSYEYEPCDQLKARELALSENEKYVKKPGEDFNSVCQGVFGFKGNVNFVIGKAIDAEIEEISADLHKNEKINAVCQIIDKQIYANYMLFANNYIAYDYLENSTEFASHYTPQQREDFLKYIDKQSIVEDVAADKMKKYLFDIYANPVRTHFGKVFKPQEENIG